ncbi:GlcNAc-PI de-N-acetylase [Acidimicrobiaceae bacterium USS-CC1]|uniref:GlcNAc-PI de-N-acetylase n=1 Tax=Acidiferrimicrobium australe TaxID=2664430 RepID=A0ABW9QQU1_9ACTN|nr:GlcNAc-PI de-N-acetylase [Acidiferrimicrobium australe]
MAVHAHPDDEATSTGGVLARYAAEGVRTVLVTCTDGSCGDGPGGVKPGEPGHDREAVAAARLVELRRSAELLGVGALELLGYRDSGMMGWATNDEPGAFWGMDVAEAAAPLVELMERHRPQVVVTYDANGFYGHPDHIMAHRIATAAAATSGVPAKLYHTAVPRSGLAEFAAALREAGVEPPGPSDREEGQFAEAEEPAWGTPDELITTAVDVSGYVEAKFAALAAHASQADNVFFLRLGPDLYGRFFGREWFVRASDRSGAAVPEDDLFAGLR